MTTDNLVYIKWCDAHTNDNWMTIEQALEWGMEENTIIESVGWIIDETEEYIVLASMLSDELTGQLLKIPTTWIRERKELIINTTLNKTR